MRIGRAILGIDAAWTLTQPSGVALVADDGKRWHLVNVAASYDAFLENDPAIEISRHRGSVPNADVLICAAEFKLAHSVNLVAIDMPLSLEPIVGRRSSDNKISTAYGARHASTHTPNETRPGKISDQLRIAFERIGYPLATSKIDGNALIEVYPHPALIELAGAEKRLPYKASKAAKYWPEYTPFVRRGNLINTWRQIIELLDRRIDGVSEALELPRLDARGHELKAFEDMLDAVVCAWVGACALDGNAIAHGDDRSAIWVPTI
jgi:predicted RNase H-like nuclease